LGRVARPLLIIGVLASATALLWRADPTAGARMALALGVAGALWTAWRVDNQTGSCLMVTILALIVFAILAFLLTGMALTG
jgi:hypothetical protein